MVIVYLKLTSFSIKVVRNILGEVLQKVVKEAGLETKVLEKGELKKKMTYVI